MTIFIPILFMSGILGKLLHKLAVVITTAILLSGVISITVTPMLCNVFLRDRHCEERSDEARSGQPTEITTASLTPRNDDLPLTEKAFEYVKQKYGSSLKTVVEHSKTTMLFLLVIIATAYLFGKVRKGFMPDSDTGQILVFTDTAQTISFDAMVQEQQQVSDVLLLKNPNIDSFFSAVGVSGRNSAVNQGTILISLKPHDQRIGADAVIDQLRSKLNHLVGLRVYIQKRTYYYDRRTSNQKPISIYYARTRSRCAI
ncbi:efflux RND transporter permease subunit [Rickettsia rhipicephali]|nr:efflux RND transporter permease subunit [Rickettsia rhipicephali]